MKVYKLHSDDGHFQAFEIDNAYIRPKSIRKLLSNLKEVVEISLQSEHRASIDIKLSFKYCGIKYIVWEPYGDNSRYWIGPESEGEYPDLDLQPLANVFLKYRPFFLAKIFGDILTLNFKSIFK